MNGVNGVGGGKTSNFDLLQKFLIKENKEAKQVLLIVDEAQNLSREALEDIRMLSNLESEAASLISIMLVGQPDIRIKLNNFRLSSFVQRMVTKYHLTALTHQETDENIAFRLQKAGGKPDLFESEAVELIYRYSGGIPRSINVVCNAALVYGFGYELESIGTPVIEQLIQDRKSLDLPNEADEAAKASARVSTEGPNYEIRKRLENFEDAICILQTQMERLSAELARKTKSVRNDLTQEMQELFLTEREHRDSIMSESTRLKENFESLQRPQAAAAKFHTNAAAGLKIGQFNHQETVPFGG